MRKLVLALSVLLLLITPALAREPEEAAMPDFGAQALEQALDGQTREALGDVSAASVGDFATQLWNIVTDALSNANLALRSALFSAGKVLAAGILVCVCFRRAGRPRRKAACSDCGGVCHHGALHARRTVDDFTGARDDYENFGLYGAAASGALVEPCRFRRERERGDAAGRRIVCNESTDKACIRRADSAGVSLYSAGDCRKRDRRQRARKNPGALRVGSAAEREGAVRGLYGVFEPQPRTDGLCGRDGGEGGAGGVFGDGAGCRVDSLGCVGVFAGKCGADSQRGRGVRDAGGSGDGACTVCAAGGILSGAAGWQGQSARTRSARRMRA